MKGTTYELLVVIANQGYSDLVMDAAREAGAGGGTVIHAQGTGAQRAEAFLGVSLVNEKEIIFIVVRSENKNRVMRSIMDQSGLDSKARSILFSLPVTGTAGHASSGGSAGGVGLNLCAIKEKGGVTFMTPPFFIFILRLGIPTPGFLSVCSIDQRETVSVFDRCLVHAQRSILIAVIKGPVAAIFLINSPLHRLLL